MAYAAAVVATMSKAAAPGGTNVLLCLLGVSPAVVTESLYALAVKPRAGELPWIPDVLQIATTATGLRFARKYLFGPGGAIARLCFDHQLPLPAHGELHTTVFTDATGQPLEDARSQHDSECVGSTLFRLIRELSSAVHSQLQVVLSGGRKQMPFLAGYALSLLGREQDRLLHVLVDAPFEELPVGEFFYPGSAPQLLQRRDTQHTLDSRQACVTLVDIPFVRLRRLLRNADALDQAGDFRAAIEQVERAERPPTLLLNFPRRQAWANGQLLKLSSWQCLLLLCYARGSAAGGLENHVAAETLQRTAREVFSELHGAHDIADARAALAVRAQHHPAALDELKSRFETERSKLNRKLRQQLGAASELFEIQPLSPGRFGMHLPAAAIERIA
jgi:CRISPR-associated protein (TIGR02584 family)